MNQHQSGLNRLFVQITDAPGGKEKLAASQTIILREKTREGGIMRRMMSARKIDTTDSNLIVSKDSDTWGYRVWLEVDAHATSISFRGTPSSRYVTGQRFDIGFYRIATYKYEKHKRELAVYPYNIAKSVESLFPNALQTIEDHNWLTHVEAAAQATGNILKGAQATEDIEERGTGHGFIGRLQKADIIAMKAFYTTKKRRLERILMNEEDYNSCSYWTIADVGEQGVAAITRDGFTADKLVGIPITRTMKTDLLETGNVYGFADISNLGEVLIFQEPKFYVDEKDGVISWWADEELTAFIGMVVNILKLELYSDDSLDIPDESDVDIDTYNRVSDGIYFPAWNQYG